MQESSITILVGVLAVLIGGLVGKTSDSFSHNCKFQPFLVSSIAVAEVNTANRWPFAIAVCLYRLLINCALLLYSMDSTAASSFVAERVLTS